MDSTVKQNQSLPPRVEGKVHGYLKLIIDQIVWSRKSPGDVFVLAFWWGDSDSVRFRPADVKAGSFKLENETDIFYTIRTNRALFEDYIRNCETLELVIINQETQEVIGTARVFNLLDIFHSKSFSRYFPILNNNSTRIGDIHVAIDLLNLPITSEMHTSDYDYLKDKKDKKSTRCNRYSLRKEKDQERIMDKQNCLLYNKNAKQLENIYNSILKNNNDKMILESPVKKFNMEVTDKLVAQVIARAQRLRGAILKESQSDDPLVLSENSMFDDSPLNSAPENEAKLYEYIIGSEMSAFDERRALDTLRSTSPTPSLIDFASKSIGQVQESDSQLLINTLSARSKIENKESHRIIHDLFDFQPKEPSPLDYVDSLRIVVESLMLSSAGYRRVRSSCLSLEDGAMTTVTYFVHYDPIFANLNDPKKKLLKDKKFVKISSRKQFDQVICFNHKAVYNVPKSCLRLSMPLKFKVYHRHLNQRLPTELGIGSMYVSDSTATKHLSTTQRVAIVNKGIKVAELKVTVELGCDGIHFGKEFVDAILGEKENIPVLEDTSTVSKESIRYKTATGTESKSSNRVSARQLDCVSSSSVTDSTNEQRNTAEPKNSKNKILKTCTIENNYKDKILLHGLIYIAEGKDLPELNTYLICRAFWREDRAASRVCLNTENPFYNFHQLVPIIHGSEFLERTKENCIVIEVYNRSSTGVDSLLGISKLPVHQLYIAYRDSLVIPHLTMSKYPVISVDGWVTVNEPVSGQNCGELLALVAVGTADQIALLEMTRGLRDSSVTPRTLRECARNTTTEESTAPTEDSIPRLRIERTFAYESETKSQECQTEISMTDEEIKRRGEAPEADDTALHTIFDQLARVMRHCKTYHDAHTDMSEASERGPAGGTMAPDLGLVPSRSNILLSSDESSIDGPGDNFQMPSAMYRSVGVGAEFDEDTNLTATATNNQDAMSVTDTGRQPSSNEQSESEDTNEKDAFFRATLEIKRAYHLPMLDPHDDIEPSTYVTFQDVACSRTTVSNVCLRSCAPIWDWKCNTRLPRDLLHNKEKRLILKIWTLRDPDTSVQIDPEKDVVMGFAAIDLSVLAFGSPVLSGWFNIIESPGEIIGQIWVSITPLENVSNTPPGNYIVTSLPYKALSHLPYSDINTENRSAKLIEREPDVGSNLADESISFLSQSLKQKLTELNEITMRLQSRLHDVTNSAFEDDFDFEAIDSEPENEATNNEQLKKICTMENNNERCSPIQVPSTAGAQNHLTILENKGNYLSSCNRKHRYFNSAAANNHSPRSSSDYQESNGIPATDDAYPVRGTRVHINHLLDKLSSQLSVPTAPSHFPVQGNVMDLLDSLRHNNINQQDSNSNNNNNNNNNYHTQLESRKAELVNTQACRKIPKRTHSIPTQTEISDDSTEESPERRVKMSTIIREELVELEESNDEDYDELTRHLVTSNVRHMGSTNRFFNPLLYQHLIPDTEPSSCNLSQVNAQQSTSPENETIKKLDSRYTQTFNIVLDSSLRRLKDLMEFNFPKPKSVPQRSEALEDFRITPSGVSENFDGNIDVTVIHKSSNDNLTARNNVESSESESSSTSSEKASSVGVLLREEDDEGTLTSSESTTSIVSRQAPDGGNPLEETDNVITVQQDETRHSPESSN